MSDYLFAIIIAFIPPALYAATTIIESSLSNSEFKDNVSLTFYSTTISLLFLPVLFLFGIPELIEPRLLPLFLAYAACEVAFLVPYYAALKRLQTSVVSALFAMSSLVVPVLSWFILGEKLHPINYIGFFIVLAASFYMTKAKGAFQFNKGFWLMVLTCAILSIDLMICTKLLTETDWVSVAFWNYILTSAIVVVLLAIKKVRRPVVASFPKLREHFKQLVLNNGLGCAAGIASLFSLSVLPVVVKDGISNTEALWVLMFGVVLKTLVKWGGGFKESVNRRQVLRKLIILVAMLGGVILLTM